ncbi:MAG TPA: chromosome segregation protein SMC [Clostridia bacterium]|nr:chromosome segregation protein SMC [Clostridia bacterium]
MYLKRLEIQGFKSFAEKTKLEFKPGITLVVGPNGSGKSNIADAIRWVLGEQSVKTLRGAKMDDLIFAGSEERHPLGFAEVSLTIDNTSGTFPLDYHEITVTRRLYRSGESDYLINRTPCRLRDLHQLFMDTGIGREGFSLIGQGKVDEVLSVKPEVRRGLLEETAGIVKYRYKKREAVQKLSETETSLVRLHDLLAELKKQAVPLAEQAAKAKQYKDKQTKLNGLLIGLLLAENEKHKKDLTKLSEQLTNLELEIENLNTQLRYWQSCESEQKLILQKKLEIITAYREKLYQAQLDLEKNESSKKLLQERKISLQTQKEQLEKEQKQLNTEIAYFREKLSELKIERQTCQEKVEKARRELELHEAWLTSETEKEKKQELALEDLKNEHFEFLQAKTQLQNTISNLREQLTVLQAKKEKNIVRLEEITQISNKALTKIAQTEKSISEITSALFSGEQNLKTYEANLLAEQTKLKKQEEKNLFFQKEKAALESRLHLLQEMERDGQGYAYGVRGLLQLKTTGKIKGIMGTVAQIIKVPPAYERAVEVVLGGSLQYIVTLNEQVAQQAISWLKNKQQGRATFLPLDTVKGRKSRGNIPQGPGVIGCLADLITYQPEYNEIISYLLGTTWLVEDLAAAVEIGKITGFRFRLVTPAGEVVNPGGSLSGGSFKTKTGNLLSRKREIAELTQQKKAGEITLTQGLQQAEIFKKAVFNARREWERAQEKIQQLRLQKVEEEGVLASWQTEKKRSNAVMAELEAEIKERALLNKNIISQKAALKERIVTLEQEIELCVEKINTLVQALDHSQGVKLEKNETLTQLRITVATHEAKLATFNEEEKENALRLDKLMNLLNEKYLSRESLIEKDSEIAGEIVTTEQQIVEILKAIKNGENLLENERKIKEDLEVDLLNCTEKIKHFTELLTEKQAEEHQLQLRFSRLETAQKSVEQRLKEQFNLTMEQAGQIGVICTNKSWALSQISDLKTALGKLGEVNPGAIDEYTRLTERLSFLNNQITDLAQAKKRLDLVIEEMDRLMVQRFREAFQCVGIAFQEIFRQLFGGGKAELVLCEPGNLLETGVEVFVQPPGKKTQNLALLSGGERTLTAIALLMAMLKVKPSPFCVLDEIESNLDEANLERFANLLTHFSRQTQFIVISHRKKTMEVGDVLYGVTMQESGVSRLVAVKLAEAQQEAS